MDKVIKISSQQGFADSYTNAQKPSNLNLLDFTIPSGMNIDMSKSYIAINAEVTNDSANPVNANFFLDVDNGEKINVPTSSLVRNCHISNDKGQVESIRRLDTLNTALLYITDEAEERKSNMNIFGTFPGPRGIGNRTSYLLDCVTNNVSPDGSTINTSNLSRNISRDIKIPLKEMFGCCVSEAYSTDKFGETRIHVETNFVKGANAGLKSIVLGGDERTSLMFDATNNYGDFTDQAGIANGDSTVKIESKGVYQNWQLVCPFFVDQQILLSATISGGQPAIVDTVHIITAMEFQGDNTTPNGSGKVFLTLSPPAYSNSAGAGAFDVSDITIKAKTDQTLTNVINRAELVLHTSTEQPDDDIVFNTYTSEEDNGNDLTSFHRQYLVEPEASGLLVALCNNSQILPNRTFESYRYSVNNEEQTSNRDVRVGTSLQYERIQRCMDRQLGLGFKNAHLKFLKNDETQAAGMTGPVSLICETLPMTEGSKKVGLSIECSAGVKQMILYKSMEKKISA